MTLIFASRCEKSLRNVFVYESLTVKYLGFSGIKIGIERVDKVKFLKTKNFSKSKRAKAKDTVLHSRVFKLQKSSKKLKKFKHFK